MNAKRLTCSGCADNGNGHPHNARLGRGLDDATPTPDPPAETDVVRCCPQIRRRARGNSLDEYVLSDDGRERVRLHFVQRRYRVCLQRDESHARERENSKRDKRLDHGEAEFVAR